MPNLLKKIENEGDHHKNHRDGQDSPSNITYNFPNPTAAQPN